MALSRSKLKKKKPQKFRISDFYIIYNFLVPEKYILGLISHYVMTLVNSSAHTIAFSSNEITFDCHQRQSSRSVCGLFNFKAVVHRHGKC